MSLLQSVLDFILWFLFGRDYGQAVAVRVPTGEPQSVPLPPLEVVPVPISMTDNQKVTLGPIQPVDKRGKPSQIFGAPKWSVSDPEVLAITPSPDGLSATLAARGPGKADWILEVQGAADASNTISKTDTVTVTAGPTADVAVPVSPPTDQ